MPEPQTPAVSLPPRDPAADDLRATVLGIVADVLDIAPDAVSETSSLLDLGAESLMFVEIVLKLESTFGVRIDRAYALPGPRTVADYMQAVRDGLARAAAETP